MAKWNVIGPRSWLPLVVVHGASQGLFFKTTGVTVDTTDDAGSREAAAALVKELLAQGFNAAASSEINRKATKPFVGVHIEHRPDTPQGELKLRLKEKAKNHASR